MTRREGHFRNLTAKEKPSSGERVSSGLVTNFRSPISVEMFDLLGYPEFYKVNPGRLSEANPALTNRSARGGQTTCPL